jgi:hypothetical protein
MICNFFIIFFLSIAVFQLKTVHVQSLIASASRPLHNPAKSTSVTLVTPFPHKTIASFLDPLPHLAACQAFHQRNSNLKVVASPLSAFLRGPLGPRIAVKLSCSILVLVPLHQLSSWFFELQFTGHPKMIAEKVCLIVRTDRSIGYQFE